LDNLNSNDVSQVEIQFSFEISIDLFYLTGVFIMTGDFSLIPAIESI